MSLLTTFPINSNHSHSSQSSVISYDSVISHASHSTCTCMVHVPIPADKSRDHTPAAFKPVHWGTPFKSTAYVVQVHAPAGAVKVNQRSPVVSLQSNGAGSFIVRSIFVQSKEGNWQVPVGSKVKSILPLHVAVDPYSKLKVYIPADKSVAVVVVLDGSCDRGRGVIQTEGSSTIAIDHKLVVPFALHIGHITLAHRFGIASNSIFTVSLHTHSKASVTVNV